MARATASSEWQWVLMPSRSPDWTKASTSPSGTVARTATSCSALVEVALDRNLTYPSGRVHRGPPGQDARQRPSRPGQVASCRLSKAGSLPSGKPWPQRLPPSSCRPRPCPTKEMEDGLQQGRRRRFAARLGCATFMRSWMSSAPAWANRSAHLAFGTMERMATGLSRAGNATATFDGVAYLVLAVGKSRDVRCAPAC
eukprot:scaffold1004_cov269-Pinguiococcus_pyrenoidosus.AAC.6